MGEEIMRRKAVKAEQYQESSNSRTAEQKQGSRSRAAAAEKQQGSDSYRRYVCRSNKDAESACWLRSGQACEHKNYKKMYAVDEVIVERTNLNYRKAASPYNKASVEGI